jgi:hypothetical protein
MKKSLHVLSSFCFATMVPTLEILESIRLWHRSFGFMKCLTDYFYLA